jgi:hypothetical protein
MFKAWQDLLPGFQWIRSKAMLTAGLSR